jgi:hypothetical protein
VTAEEHYREAERLISARAGASRPNERDVARAQVHATLALAAATARAGGRPIDSSNEIPGLNL